MPLTDPKLVPCAPKVSKTRRKLLKRRRVCRLDLADPFEHADLKPRILERPSVQRREVGEPQGESLARRAGDGRFDRTNLVVQKVAQSTPLFLFP